MLNNSKFLGDEYSGAIDLADISFYNIFTVKLLITHCDFVVNLLVDNMAKLNKAEEIKRILGSFYDIGGFDLDIYNEWTEESRTEFEKIYWDNPTKERFGKLLNRIKSQISALAGKTVGSRKLAEILSLPIGAETPAQSKISHTSVNQWSNSFRLTPSFLHVRKISSLKLESSHLVGWSPSRMILYLKGEIDLDNPQDNGKREVSEHLATTTLEIFVRNSPANISLQVIIKGLNLLIGKIASLIKTSEENALKAEKSLLKEALTKHRLKQIAVIQGIHPDVPEGLLFLNAEDKLYLYNIAKYYFESYIDYVEGNLSREEQLLTFVKEIYQYAGISESFISSVSSETIKYECIERFCDYLNDITLNKSLSPIALISDLSYSDK